VINWDAIGAIGEIIGAIAVVITLLYLAVQLRQNTRSTEHSIKRGVHSDARAWLDKLIENPELTDLYRAGMNGDELSSSDRLRFSMLLDQLFSHWDHAYAFDAFDFVDNSHIHGVLAKPGGASHWKRALSRIHSFHPGFVEHVNTILAEIEADQRDA
jgi:hypothetical protein